MLAINQSKSDAQPSTAHLLPCRIHRDGKVEIDKHIWNPVTKTDGQNGEYHTWAEHL
jgi:hypothetical protein